MKKLLIVMLCAVATFQVGCSSYLDYLNPWKYNWGKGNASVEQDQASYFDDEDMYMEDMNDQEIYDQDQDAMDEEGYLEDEQPVTEQPKSTGIMDKLKNVISRGTTEDVSSKRSVNATVEQALERLQGMTHGHLQQLVMDALSQLRLKGEQAIAFVKTNMMEAQKYMADQAATSMKEYSNAEIAQMQQYINTVLTNL